MKENKVNISDFTNEELKRAMTMLIYNDISFAVELAYLLKEEYNIKLLENMIYSLNEYDIKMAIELWNIIIEKIKLMQ